MIAPEIARVAEASPPPKGTALPLRVGFSWTLAGMLVYAACQWGMLMAIARLGSPEKVGQFAVGLALAGPAMLLANLELRSLLSTDVRRQFRFPDYLGLRVLTTLVSLVVIGGLAAALGGGGELATVVVALGAYKATEAASDLHYGLFQRQGRNDRMARSLMLRGPIGLVGLAGGLALTGSVAWGVAAMAAGGALVFLLHDLPCAAALLRRDPGEEPESPRPRFAGRILGRLALLSAPLGLLTMLHSLNAGLPALLLQKASGAESVGVFAILLSLVSAGHVGVNALGHSASVRLAAQFAAGDRRAYVRLLARMLAVAALLGAAGMTVAILLGRPILLLCFGPAYADASGVLVWLMAAGATGYLAATLSYSMIASRQLRIQPLILLGSTVLILALGTTLIPRFGLTGAALAVLAASAFQLAANLAVTLHELRRDDPVAPAGRLP